MKRKLEKSALSAAVVASLVLASCGPLIGVGGQGDAPARYALQPPAEPGGGGELLAASIMVEEPAASDAFDGHRIVLRPSPLEIKYYASARWTDRAPQMIRDLLSAAVAGKVRDVGGETMPTAPDYRLQSQLQDFHAIYDGKGPPVIRVTLNAKLFSRTPLALVGSRRFSAEVKAGEDRIPLIAKAFNEATRQVLSEAADWVGEEIASGQDSADAS